MTLVDARTAYPTSAPSPRVRICGFQQRLAEAGVDLRYRPTLSDAEYRTLTVEGSAVRKAAILLRGAARAASARPSGELTLVHRLLHLVPIPGVDPPRRLDLYDFDDALYLGSAGAANRRAGRLKREAARWGAQVERARLVIAGSAHLAEVAHSRRSGPIEVIPSCVEPATYELRAHREAEVLTVGWIGSASTVSYLAPVLAAFERINAAGVRARLVVVGGQLDYRVPWLEQRSWDLEREAEDLAGFDLGVMPLPDDEWARGKCGYKLLQYFAAGVPAIASPVGVAPVMTGAGERGILARDEREWERAINELAESAEVRGQMGERARSYVEADYSYERWAPELAQLIEGLA